MPKPIDTEGFIGLRVDPADKQRSLRLAQRSGYSLSEWVRRAIAEKAIRDLQQAGGGDEAA